LINIIKTEVLENEKEVYFPLLEEKSIENIRPGQIVVQAIDLNEPPGKPIKKMQV